MSGLTSLQHPYNSITVNMNLTSWWPIVKFP